jgi:hypothetical protein
MAKDGKDWAPQALTLGVLPPKFPEMAKSARKVSNKLMILGKTRSSAVRDRKVIACFSQFGQWMHK